MAVSRVSQKHTNVVSPDLGAISYYPSARRWNLGNGIINIHFYTSVSCIVIKNIVLYSFDKLSMPLLINERKRVPFREGILSEIPGYRK